METTCQHLDECDIIDRIEDKVNDEIEEFTHNLPGRVVGIKSRGETYRHYFSDRVATCLVDLTVFFSKDDPDYPAILAFLDNSEYDYTTEDDGVMITVEEEMQYI